MQQHSNRPARLSARLGFFAAVGICTLIGSTPGNAGAQQRTALSDEMERRTFNTVK